MFMKQAWQKIKILLYVGYAGLAVVAFAPIAHAAPFGQGEFGADIPFGAATSISVALDGTVNLDLVSNGSEYSAKGSHTVTVTSTDPVGYALYAYTLGSTDMIMNNGSDTIPVSSNSSPNTLAVNTWGYNLDNSDNFLGLAATPSIIKTTTGPFKNGDITTVSYGVKTNLVKAAGSYKVSVVYTAAALSQ